MGDPPFFYLYHVLQLLNSPEYHLIVLSDQSYPLWDDKKKQVHKFEPYPGSIILADPNILSKSYKTP